MSFKPRAWWRAKTISGLISYSRCRTLRMCVGGFLLCGGFLPRTSFPVVFVGRSKLGFPFPWEQWSSYSVSHLSTGVQLLLWPRPVPVGSPCRELGPSGMSPSAEVNFPGCHHQSGDAKSKAKARAWWGICLELIQHQLQPLGKAIPEPAAAPPKHSPLLSKGSVNRSLFC